MACACGRSRSRRGEATGRRAPPLPCREPPGSGGLREQPLVAPAVALAGETLAVVVAERALHPELDGVGHHPEAGPVWRARDAADVEAEGGGRDGLLELQASGHRLRLARRPRTELAQPGPRGEIGVRFLFGDRFNEPVDADLALEFGPVQAEGGAGVGAEVGGLGAFEIRVENEAAGVAGLQQHHAHARPAGGVGGGEGHGGGIVGLSGLGGGEPFLEEGERGGVHGRSMPHHAGAGCVKLGQGCARIAGGAARIRLALAASAVCLARMSRFTDTIAALATPAGTAALAVVRVSGPDTRRLAEDLFGRLPPPRMLRRRDYRRRDGGLVDDVMFAWFEGPRSYTGEDALEITSHGNPFVAQGILEDLAARGCRPAAPGEFTQRAFLNGRMDLSQAEAVMDLIHARSERALAAAQRQLRGALGQRVQASIDLLLETLARIEAYIDFPDEDLPQEDQRIVLDAIERLEGETSRLLATNHYGEMLRDGVKVAIVGAPNAGKSSLLNQLVGRDRAIVSDEPGTTRDFIEERVLIGPHLVRLIDTAGLNPTPGRVEKLGIEKTLELCFESDVIVYVVDTSESGDAAASAAGDKIPGRCPIIVVANKCDLPSRREIDPVKGRVVIRLSARTGEGLEELRRELERCADRLGEVVGEETVVINARHAQALQHARDGLEAARSKIVARGPVELIASDLRGAMAGFEEIAGKVDNERMLDRLFAAFCIGK